MAHSTDIVGYTFRADQFCPRCIVNQVNGHHPNAVNRTAKECASAEDSLDIIAERLGGNFDRYDERSFDSDDFPKVIFRDMLDSSYNDDGPERCGQCHEVLGD